MGKPSQYKPEYIKSSTRTISQSHDGGGAKPAKRAKARRPTRPRQQHGKNRRLLRSERFKPEMEDLKNASQRGDAGEALEASFRMTRSMTGNCNATLTEQFLKSVRLLFTPDAAGFAAIYYAALFGQAQLVQIFLALLVWERAFCMKLPAARLEAVRPTTMLGWLEEIGFTLLFFSRSDLESCIMNALNDETKDEFHRKVFSWRQIMTIVTDLKLLRNSSPPAFHVQDKEAKQSAGKRSFKSKRLPKLCVEDECDDFDETDELYDDEEEEEEEEDDLTDDEDDSSELDDNDESDGHGNDIDDVESQQQFARAVPVMIEDFDDDDDSIPENTIPPAALKSTNDESFDEVHLDDTHNTIYSHEMEELQSVGKHEKNCEDEEIASQWTNVDVKDEDVLDSHDLQLLDDFAEIFWNNEEVESEMSFAVAAPAKDELSCATSEWDVVADNTSVMSLDSLPVQKSYKEALLEEPPATPILEKPSPSRKHKLASVSESTLKEDDDDDEGDDYEPGMYDASFLVDGAKGARGGKRSRMFKGEGRTLRPKYRR